MASKTSPCQLQAFKTPEKTRTAGDFMGLAKITDSPFGEFVRGLPDLTPQRHGTPAGATGILDVPSPGGAAFHLFSNTNTPIRKEHAALPTATTPDHQPIQNAANEMATPVPSSDAIDLGMLLGTPLSLYSLTPLLRLQESSTLLDYADLQVFASSPLISSARKTGVATPKSLGRMRRQEHELVLNHEGGGPLIENFDAFSTPLRSPGCAMKTRDIAPQPGLDPVPKELCGKENSGSLSAVVSGSAGSENSRRVEGSRRRGGNSQRRLVFDRNIMINSQPEMEASVGSVDLKAEADTTPVPETPLAVQNMAAEGRTFPPNPADDFLAASCTSTETPSQTTPLGLFPHIAQPTVVPQQAAAVAAAIQRAVSAYPGAASDLMKHIYGAAAIHFAANKSPAVEPKTPQESKAQEQPVSEPQSAMRRSINGGQVPSQHKGCNCKNSKCLKLYCDCFKTGLFCNGCSCKDCQNDEGNREVVQSTMQQIKQRDPEAFSKKIKAGSGGEKRQHRKGCNCKKSHCMKKYCECFQAGVPCGAACKCVECENCNEDGTNQGADAKVTRPTQRPQARVTKNVQLTQEDQLQHIVGQLPELLNGPGMDGDWAAPEADGNDSAMTSRPGTRLFQVGQKRGLEDATTREDNRKKRLTDSMKHDPDSSRGDEILEETTAQTKDATNTADVQAQQ